MRVYSHLTSHVSTQLRDWICEHIKTPIVGFEQKQNRTQVNAHYPVDKQLKQTRYQVLLIAEYYARQGYTDDQIRRILDSYFLRTASSS